MIISAHHTFKVVRGATFDFRLQYRLGPQTSVVPVDLSPYSAQWTITSLDGNTIYNQFDNGGIIGTSGVFFGGDSNDPTNGIIDLVLTEFDTIDITWTQAAYWLTVRPPTLQVIPLLSGSMAVTGTLP